jgi:hypothetical protein
VAAHSFLWIGDQPMYACRESYIPELLALFRDNERVDQHTASFAARGSVLARRLEALGFGYQPSRERLQAFDFDDGSDLRIDFDSWSQALRAEVLGSDSGADLSAQENQFRDDVPAHEWGGTPAVVLRAILADWTRDVEITLDLKEVVSRDHVRDAVDLCAQAFEEQRRSARMWAPLVVLTEGSTDAEFLSGALDVLYPEMAGYVRFLDYAQKPEGGASALARGVKAFAAAGIGNRIVALFDNDAAGLDAIRSLGATALPSNFRLVPLPHLDFAADYPTFGPGGLARLDINGYACALELYLGVDILTGEDGDLERVQWTSYIAGVQRYQGELINKSLVQSRFREKLKRQTQRDLSVSDGDWSGLLLVLDRILGAFDQ